MNETPPPLPDQAGKTARKSSALDLVQHLSCLALPPLTFLALFATDNGIHPPQSVVIAFVAIALWAFVVSLFLFRRFLPRVRRSIPQALAALLLSSFLTFFMFPIHSAASDKAYSVKMGHQGRCIILDSLRDEYDEGVGAWPARGSFRTSDEAFQSLLDAEILDRTSPWTVFRPRPNAGGSGTPAGATNECRWVLLAGATNCAWRTPVLWSRNLRGVRAEDFAGGPPEKTWGARFAKNEDPRMGRFVCIVRRDGSVDIVEGRNLTRETFLGGGSADPAAVEVLEPGP